MKAEMTRAMAVLCCIAVLTGCGGPAPMAPTQTLTYENVAGTYTGNVNGMIPGFTLMGTLTLNLQQVAAVLSGGYTVVATVSDGVTQAAALGTVTLNGTVAPGSNPALNFTVRSEQCPNAPSSDWTGSFQSGSGVLTMSGVLHLLNACVVQLSFPVTISMTR
jgi:hypothetical protein